MRLRKRTQAVCRLWTAQPPVGRAAASSPNVSTLPPYLTTGAYGLAVSTPDGKRPHRNLGERLPMAPSRSAPPRFPNRDQPGSAFRRRGHSAGRTDAVRVYAGASPRVPAASPSTAAAPGRSPPVGTSAQSQVSRRRRLHRFKGAECKGDTNTKTPPGRSRASLPIASRSWST